MKVPKGFLFSGISSGVKKNKLDLGLIYVDDHAQSVCYFTENKVKAASVITGLRKLKESKNKISAVVVNSGNANCFTGKQGISDADSVSSEAARILGYDETKVLMCSTGIIGKRLEVKKIIKSIPQLVDCLQKDPFPFARSILTTDTCEKVVTKEVTVDKKPVRILGIAKGAGMIYPKLNQATMLAFIMCDVVIDRNLLKEAASRAVDESFSSITIDGCSSTNDTVLFLASGKAGNGPLLKKGSQFVKFTDALRGVCLELSKKIVQDAEGASKFITITVKGASTKDQAKKAGLAVANSALFKTAIYGENNNWGRIVAALGQTGIAVKDDVSIVTSSLKRKHITVSIDLKQGLCSWMTYTSDLTPEYIKINAEYS